MANILEPIFANVFYWMKIIVSWLICDYFPKGPVDNMPSLDQIMARHKQIITRTMVDPVYLHIYRQVSNIRRTKSQHLKDSRTV